MMMMMMKKNVSVKVNLNTNINALVLHLQLCNPTSTQSHLPPALKPLISNPKLVAHQSAWCCPFPCHSWDQRFPPWNSCYENIRGAATKPFRNKDGQAIRTLAKSKQEIRHTNSYTASTTPKCQHFEQQWFPEHPKRVRNFFLQGTQKCGSGSTKHKSKTHSVKMLHLFSQCFFSFSDMPWIWNHQRQPPTHRC